jgi:hypothetical protein
VHVKSAFAAARHLDASESLCLQSASKSLRALDAILARGLFQIGEGGDAETLIKLEHLVSPQAGHGEHFQDTRRNFLSHGLKAWMSSRTVQFCDDIGDGVADARDFGEPSCL